ncbi:MAG: sulfotransferase domain-containing protein [Pseudomonadota bacterium]
MSAAPRTVIHIGPGKTATTFLQARVFRNHSQINYLGKNHPNPELDDAIRKLTRLDSQRFPSQHVKNIFAAEIAAHPEKPVHLLSEELLGTWAFIDAHLIAVRLKDVFGAATIIITLRNTIDWLQSIYFWCLQVGKFNAEWEFNEWVRYWTSHPPIGNPLSSLHTRHLTEVYASVFGEENIKFVVYEDLKRDSIGFAHGIAEIVGVDKEEMAAIFEAASKVKGEKSRISQAAADYFRRIDLVKGTNTNELVSFLNKHLDMYCRPESRDQLTTRIDALANTGETKTADRYDLFMTVYKQTERQMPNTPSASATLNPKLEKILVDRFGKQLQWVQKKYGIDLASRGYSL